MGLRPVWHQKDHRTEGHWFITILAYPEMHVIRTCLQDYGITRSWATIRNWLSSQKRATFCQKLHGGLAVHSRVTGEPDLYQRAQYDALHLDPVPLSTQTTTVKTG